jgi:hypothetical protein
LTGSQATLHESNHGHWQSIKHVIPNIDHVIALESVVAHPHLNYAGTLDGIISYRGEQCLVDWKTSEKKRMELKNCFSYPHQIVAYAGAVNYDDHYYPIQVSFGKNDTMQKLLSNCCFLPYIGETWITGDSLSRWICS